MFFHLSEELQTLEVSFFAKWEGSDAEQHQKKRLQSYDHLAGHLIPGTGPQIQI